MIHERENMKNQYIKNEERLRIVRIRVRENVSENVIQIASIVNYAFSLNTSVIFVNFLLKINRINYEYMHEKYNIR